MCICMHGQTMVYVKGISFLHRVRPRDGIQVVSLGGKRLYQVSYLEVSVSFVCPHSLLHFGLLDSKVQKSLNAATVLHWLSLDPGPRGSLILIFKWTNEFLVNAFWLILEDHVINKWFINDWDHVVSSHGPQPYDASCRGYPGQSIHGYKPE